MCLSYVAKASPKMGIGWKIVRPIRRPNSEHLFQPYTYTLFNEGQNPRYYELGKWTRCAIHKKWKIQAVDLTPYPPGIHVYIKPLSRRIILSCHNNNSIIIQVLYKSPFCRDHEVVVVDAIKPIDIWYRPSEHPENWFKSGKIRASILNRQK